MTQDNYYTSKMDIAGSHNKTYIIALDIGTTTLRAHVYDTQTNIVGAGSKKIELLYPKTGWVEMDPGVLWQQVQDVIKEAIAAANLKVSDIACMGITTQRGTFITWDRDSHKPFHNFITWQDLRGSDYVKQWNESITLKSFNAGAKLLHGVSRQKRFLAAAVLKFQAMQVSMRLLWVLNNNLEMRRRLNEQRVQFGTLDTWLLWKFTEEKLWCTEISCASSTGMFDPFVVEWSNIVNMLLGIPLHMLPPIKDTCTEFCRISKGIFGAEIPITSVIADQQGAMFGQCCFNVGDVKCTLGTGTFLDLNTGNKPHASIAGLYPIVGWKIGNEIVYIAEGRASDTGPAIDWLRSIDMYDDLNELSRVAESVPDSGGVYFVNSFNGLQAPINDDKACSGILGLNPSTSKAQIVRALLENISFRFKLLYETALTETRIPLSHIRADGGVSNNDFIMQLIADITNQSIERPCHTDMTSLGAAFLAGLTIGIWKDKEELLALRVVGKKFRANNNRWHQYKTVIQDWERAMKRCMFWYKEDK
ncbi:unnamed protein product [Owenia fusiformis]|uniref:Glycerol kinase 5 n=1 Tax=Owenia fusiformis TaxID=6347 RepID=A0A8J1T7D1_OWEFU|nr:unnamed protein product [Owenia fusiformis]